MGDLVDIRSLEEAKTRFTDLGSAISDLSQVNIDTFESLISSIETGFGSVIDNLSKDTRLSDGSKMVGISEQYAASVATKMGSMSRSLGGVFDGMEKTFTDLERSLSQTASQAAATAAESVPQSEGGDEGAGGGLLEEEKQKAGPKRKQKSALGRYMASEGRTLKGRISGMLSRLKIPQPKAIAAGVLGVLVYGFMDRDRVRAQTGEMKNILIAAYDDGVKGALQKGTRQLGAMQESFQQFLGMQREEIQATAQAFVDGGFSVNQMLQKMDVNLGRFQSNAISVTFALDKMFELPGGESAKRMVSMMAEYGKTVDEAKNSLLRLYMVGKESGVGAMQFIKNVEEAGSELAKMGYDIDNVLDIYKHVTDEFEKMGVPKQFAGRQAALGMQQVAGGIAKMSDNWKVVLGERLGYGRGIEARQKMMDAFARVAEGKNNNEVLRIVQTIFEMAMQATGENESAARYYMENQMGLGSEGARLISKIGKDLREGKTVEAAQAARDNIVILKNSFQTESQKRSQFELMTNKFMKGVANFGQGLMGLIIKALAYLIAFFKAIPQIISNIVSQDWEANQEIAAMIDHVVGSTEKDKALLFSGIDKMVNAAQGMAKDIIGPSLKALKDAWAYDPYKTRQPTVTTVSPGQQRPGVGGGEGSQYEALGDPSMAVNIPLSELKKPRKILEANIVPKDEKGQKKKGAWAGTGLRLIFQGVDGEGNITVIISGNCPNCGYSFGESKPPDYSSMNLPPEGKYSGQDVEALARMIRSETGDVTIDPAGRHKERVGVAWTALNRKGARRGGGSLYKTITQGRGWGAADARRGRPGRQFATGATPSKETVEFARSILRGDPYGGRSTADWTKDMPGQGKGRGATGFVHSPGDADLISPWWKDQPGEVVAEVPVPGKGKEARFYRTLK